MLEVRPSVYPVGVSSYTSLTGLRATPQASFAKEQSVDGEMINYGEAWVLLPSSHTLSMNVILQGRKELKEISGG